MITNYKLYGSGKKWSNYNDYFKENILDIIEYRWVSENYNRPLDKLLKMAESSDKESREYIRLYPILSKIKDSRVKTLFDLFDVISTEEKLSKFLSRYRFKNDNINKFLYQVQNYMLPKKAQLRDYIFKDDPSEMEYFEILKKIN